MAPLGPAESTRPLTPGGNAAQSAAGAAVESPAAGSAGSQGHASQPSSGPPPAVQALSEAAKGSPSLLPAGVDAEAPESFWSRVKRIVIGKARDPGDRRVFHSLALVPFLAWVGLGADGLSSASYGPSEAYMALGGHVYLALVLAVMVPATVFIISAGYSQIIAAFPQGGGGYLVATKLLGPTAGVVSGCALLVDYALTITVSIAAAGDAVFSLPFMPPEWQPYKLTFEIALIFLGIALNIRGVKESVLPLVPIFLVFLVTHALLIGGGVLRNIANVGQTVQTMRAEFAHDVDPSVPASLGWIGMILLVLRAYSLGAGTYTGIEAVSNGLNIMREPRVKTGRKTMRYMSWSLAITASGLLLCYLLMGVQHDPDKTLNAVLAERLAAGLGWGGGLFVILTLVSEAAILAVAGQTGFIGGPRVLANMALDGWVPRRFASLSDRLTTQNGIILMGLAALTALLFTRGHVSTLVVMYSINVFITFALSMGGMLRMAMRNRARAKAIAAGEPGVIGGTTSIPLFVVGLILCVTILLITSVEKFTEGGWVTLAVTGVFVALCFLIHNHYRDVTKRVIQLQRDLKVPEKAHAPKPPPFDPVKPTAAVLVGGYSGLGMHTMLQAMSSFGGHFKNVVFVSVGVVDSGTFKGEEEMDALYAKTREDLEKYVDLAHRLGIPAQYRLAVGLDPVEELENLCLQVQKEFPRIAFFAGQLTFKQERWFDRILHNQTAYTLQRRLHWAGIPILILPIRVK